MKRLIIMTILALFLMGAGWEGNYDVRWNITVTNSCDNSVTVYPNSYIMNETEVNIEFLPNQSRGSRRGRGVSINTLSGCTSITKIQVDD
jgi:hypothetical protein